MRKHLTNGSHSNGGAERLVVHPHILASIGTEGQIELRHALDLTHQFFGCIPPHIVALALDSTGQVSCEAPLLRESDFLNIAQTNAEYIMNHLAESPGIQKWFSAGRSKLTGNGVGGDRTVGELLFVAALPKIAGALTKILAQFRPDAVANLEAECNRDRRLTSKGIIVNGSRIDVWIMSTTVGGTCAATVALATLMAELGKAQKVRLTQNLLLLGPEIVAEQAMTVTQMHKLTNTYAAMAELYSAQICQPPFAIETLKDVLKQDGRLFQSIVLTEPATGGLERHSRQLAETLFHLVTGAVGTQYHRKGVDMQTQVSSLYGKYRQKRIFSTVGSATLYAAPENVQTLAQHTLLAGVLDHVLSDAPAPAVPDGLLDNLDVSFAKLRGLQPSFPPLQPRWMTVRSVEKGIIAQAPILSTEFNRHLETAKGMEKKRLETGRKDILRELNQTLQQHGGRAAVSQCDEIVQLLGAEKSAIYVRLGVVKQARGRINSGNSARERLDAYNQRNQLTVEERFLEELALEYKGLVDWFVGYRANAQAVLDHVGRLCREHENLLKIEVLKDEQARPHRVLDAENIKELLEDQKPALFDKAVRLLEQAFQDGELTLAQVGELREQATTLAAEQLRPYQSVRQALSRLAPAKQQILMDCVVRSAEPSLRHHDDYDQIEETVFVSLSDADTDLLGLIPAKGDVICSQQWCEEAVVVVRAWYGFEPSAMHLIHEARAAFVRESSQVAQSSSAGAARELVPFVDRRFVPLPLAVPSGTRRAALLLIPLSYHLKGPIQYDPVRGYVYRDGDKVIELGGTRQEAFENLVQEENRLPGLPPFEMLLGWNKQQFEKLGAERAIDTLEQTIDRQEQFCKNPDLLTDRLILEDELLALRLCCHERRVGQRRQAAFLTANRLQTESDAPEPLAT